MRPFRTRTPLAVQADHAALLRPGTAVIVRDDNGRDNRSTVVDAPWCLGGHTYVVNCDGYRAFDVMRVRLDLEGNP